MSEHNIHLNDISIHESKNVDPKFIRHLFEQTEYTKDRSISDIKIMLANTNIVVLAMHDGELVGFSQIMTDFMYKVAIWDLIVDEEYRGLGIANKIMEYLTEHEQLKDIPIWCVHTLGQQEFFEHFGFKSSPSGMFRATGNVPHP